MSRLQQFLESLEPHDYINHLDTISYLSGLEHIAKTDPLVADSLVRELESQRNSLKMIPSENYTSLRVQIAMGNLFSDKYAEGYPQHRFYAGCEQVDRVESHAASLAQELFQTDHAYVQPHSGADANLIAFWATLIKRVEKPYIEKLGKKNVAALTAEEYEAVRQEFSKQKLLGMALDCGGHLTHGSRVNLSSKMFQAISYHVDPKTHLIDYKQIRDLAKQHKPAILLAGYSAYPRLLDFSIFKEIADEINATLMVDMAHFSGLVAGKALTGVHNPAPYADIITSTTHKTLRGPRGGLILCTKEYSEFINKGCPFVMGGPLENIIAAKAVAFHEAGSSSFKTYAKNVIENAQAFAEQLQSCGAQTVTGGTDNHLIVLDVQKSFGLTGRQAEDACTQAGITLNRNTVPNDPNGPWYCAGIRLGTPALTTRGLGPQEMREIAQILFDLLDNTKPSEGSRAKFIIDEKKMQNCQNRVQEILKHFPLYPEIGNDGTILLNSSCKEER